MNNDRKNIKNILLLLFRHKKKIFQSAWFNVFMFKSSLPGSVETKGRFFNKMMSFG